MTPPYLSESSLIVNGKVLLKGVPSNVVVLPVTDSFSAAFIGASTNLPSPRHVFSLGVLQESRFVCLFRHKIWWMIPRFGSLGNEIPLETQFLLLEVRQKFALSGNDGHFEHPSDDTFYVLILPVLEGQFRATLQGNSDNELEFCVESGDADVQSTEALESVFVNSGTNPFKLIEESILIIERQKGTFTHIKHKQKPPHLDWFGWCTWDAFYKDVSTQGIKEGLKSFLEGGCSPKFMIIDDGWQDTINDLQKEGEPFVEGSQFASKLVDIKESASFMGSGDDISCSDLRSFVEFVKGKYGLKYVYAWHALTGYWGGLLPSSDKLKAYDPKLCYPIQSPGNVGNLRDIAMDSLEKYGIALVEPKKIFNFYNDLHSYLTRSGIDGVKVDVQNVIETLGTGYGGRVSLTRKYQEALEDSVARNFKDNNLICCMSHNSDSIYSSKTSATARASEDFLPQEPAFQTLHITSVAFNSLLLGEIFVPDWDMFQSNHYTADFHAAARALGGCAVYVSDKPGMHDFDLLKKLVLPDGSILRARFAGRPTLDCLFVDTVMDGKSLLKIWNLNKLSGIVGVFNCQGAGTWPLSKDQDDDNRPRSASKSRVLTCSLCPLDVNSLQEVANESWNGDCAIYSFNKGSLSLKSNRETIEVSLDTLEFEIFTVSPIRAYGALQFAPLGLIDMYNSGGATEGLSYTTFDSSTSCVVRVSVQGCGRFGAYSNEKPTSCSIDGEKHEFEYNSSNKLLVVYLEAGSIISNIDIFY